MNFNFRLTYFLCIPALLVLFACKTSAPEGQAAEKIEKSERIVYPAPASHNVDWERFHGRAVMPGESDNLCSACHVENDCRSCHLSRTPADHKGTWHTTTHGQSAEADKDRCAVCHRQNFCTSCHMETAPRTHSANWKKDHCITCHETSSAEQGNNCKVCHKLQPHSSAPHPLNNALDCLSCHAN